MKKLLNMNDIADIQRELNNKTLNVTHMAAKKNVTRQVIQYHVRKLRNQQPLTTIMVSPLPPKFIPKPPILLEIETEEIAKAAEQRARFADQTPTVPYTGGMPPPDPRLRKAMGLPSHI